MTGIKKSADTTIVDSDTMSLLEVGKAIVFNIVALKASNTALTDENESLRDQLKDAVEEVSRLKVQVVELKEDVCSSKNGGSVSIYDLTSPAP